MDNTVATRPPNILIIMSDDQGPWAMNCAGTPELVTPAMDRLAAEGTLFTNMFCTSPVCSPARASFLTGTIPSRHGVHDWIKSGNIEVEDGVTWCGKDRPIEYLQGRKGFTDILAANEYRCGLAGKWHLGASGTPQKGHSFWCAHSLGGDSYTDYFIFDNGPDLAHQSQYVTDLFTDRALTFLDQHGRDEKPFCLSVHYTAPHAPWRRHEQPEDIWRHYERTTIASLPVCPPHPWGGWNPSPEKRRETVEGYFTTITAMDCAIDRLLDKLDTLDIAENTLVLFTSDNGFNVGHHGILGKGNGTFPMNMFEESVKVPFIARLPGKIPPGRRSDAMLSHYDVRPTLLNFAGVEDPEGQALPGTSAMAEFLGDDTRADRDVVVFDEYGPVRMIRDREWKYVHRYPYGPHELYNLADDPGETTNLVDESRYSDIVARRRCRLEEWFLQHADPAMDGARQGVTSKGQIDRVGPLGEGRPAFF